MARTRLRSFAAYHGGSWSPRARSHADECARGEIWPFAGVNSEFAPLKEVLLFHPGRAAPVISHPEKAQHLRTVDWKKLGAESRRLEKVFESHGIRVRRLEADWFPQMPPNLMFARDQFFMTPWGAVLGRLASRVRAGEEKWAQLALARQGIPLLSGFDGFELFEGADALWLTPQDVLIGVGNRTNREAARALTKILARHQVKVHVVPLPREVQHLLGLVQVIGPREAMVRSEISPRTIPRLLEHFAYKIREVPEVEEVTQRQGMNIVVISPRRIIMPTHCPRLKRLYGIWRLKIAAEVPFTQFLNAAGGPACATGILSRSLIR